MNIKVVGRNIHTSVHNKRDDFGFNFINMLEFLVDNIFVVFGGKVFQQIVGIPMGTNCAPLLADIFLYSYEADFIQSLLSSGKKKLASQFNFTYRYIDDVLSINNPDFENYLGQMYPAELEIKDTTESNTSASYLDLLMSIESDGQLRTSLYDKRDDFTFHITNFPFLSSNIPSSPPYGVFISQLIRYARACSSYECFILRAARLSSKLLGQGYVMERLKSSLRKFYGRYGDLIKHYEVSLSQMLHDILGHDRIQWLPFDQTLHQFTNLLPNWTLLPILTLLQNFGGFHRTLQRVRLANRGRLLLRTPGPVPLGTCICSNVETILSWTCHVYGPLEFRTSLGTSILLPIVNFPWLSGDVPRLPSYGIYISQLVRFARCCTSVFDFHSKNLQITSKLLTQGYRYHKLRKTFGKFFRSYSVLLSKFGEISFQDYVSKGITHPVFYGDLVYKLRRFKGEANFISSGSKIVKRLRRRQYDPAIIEMTICLVLGPFTALYKSFLKHCTLTNKAVRTIWRALSKPLRGDRGPDPRPSDC